jgi:cobalt-zinc-cadmium efflux system outer membrane protein
MHRFLRQTLPPAALLLGLGLLAGCAVPSSKDNLSGAAELVARQSAAPFSWRRTTAVDPAVLRDIGPLLTGGVSAPESIAIAFIASPDLQLQLERLEISRAELVAASTFPNPVAVMGLRAPGGNLSAFYPERNVTVGVLQNVLALLNLPARRRIAQRDLARVRLEVADRIVGLAAEVNQAYLEYVAAQRVLVLRERAAAAALAAADTIVVEVANGKGYTALDLALERNTVFSADSSLLRSRLEAASARAKLAQLMGIAGLRDDWQTTDDLPALPASDPDLTTLEARALEQRFDIRAVRETFLARLDSLKTQRQFRWLGSLELGLFREGSSGGISFTGPNAVVELPLFDQRQAQLLAADSEVRTALRSAESLALTARTELRTHAAELTATRALVEKYRDAVLPNQRHILSQLGTASEPGSVDRLHLRLSSLGAEEEAVGYLRDYWRARAALARAAGDWQGLTGWPVQQAAPH